MISLRPTRRFSAVRSWFQLLLLVGLWCGITVDLSADDDRDQLAGYFAQLRERRLFDVAEGYALRRLGEPRLSSAVRDVLTLELARTFSDHSRFTLGGEQSDLRKRAEQTIRTALQRDPDQPLRLLYELELALFSAKQGEFDGQYWSLTRDRSLYDQTTRELTEARQQLQSMREKFVEALNEASKRGTPKDGLTGFELRAISKQIDVELGRVCLAWAEYSTEGESVRQSRLEEARESLEPGGKSRADTPENLQCRLLLARYERLSGHLPQADHWLKKLESPTLPESLQQQTLAERIRWYRAQNQPTEAVQAVLEFRQTHPLLTGEVQFENLHSLIALWKIAQEKQQADLAAEFAARIEAFVKRTELEVGGYWGYWCRLLLEQYRDVQTYGAELAFLIRQAQTDYTQGRLDEALAAYGHAAAKAHQQGHEELAFEMGFGRGSILLNHRRWQEAADTFRDIANELSSQPKADEAHLLWAYCLGRLYDEQQSDERREAYRQALAEHRRRYARFPTAVEATWMLARLEEHRKQWRTALELYQAIPVDHNRHDEAVAAQARCYEEMLDALADEHAKRDEWVTGASTTLEAYRQQLPAMTEPLNQFQAEFLLRYSAIRLQAARPDYRQVDGDLVRITESWPIVEDRLAADATRERETWKVLLKKVAQLRILSLAGQRRFLEARRFVDGLSQADPAEVLSVLDGLMQLTAAAGETTRHRLGQLQLEAALKLNARRKMLSAETRELLDRCLAQGYVANDQPQMAVAAYRRLLEQHPRDIELLTTIAELQIRCDMPEHYREAKQNWNTLAKLHPKGSVPWLNARYQTAYCAVMLKETAEAKKILGVTRLLYPDLGNADLKQKFTELERRLN